MSADRIDVLAVLDGAISEGERFTSLHPDPVAVQHLTTMRAARAAVAQLIEVADRIERCAYAVSTEIDSRGYRWSQAYLDQVLPDLRAALARVTGGAS